MKYPEEIEALKKKEAKEYQQLHEDFTNLESKMKQMQKGKTIKQLNAFLHEGSLRSVWSMITRSSKSLLSLLNSNTSRMRSKSELEKLDLINQNIQILAAIVIKKNTDNKTLTELAMTEYE